MSANHYHLDNTVYGYINSDGGYNTLSEAPSIYWDKDGIIQYNFPNSASQLPQVVYGGETYYFDTLIKNGDKYCENVFTPMDTIQGKGESTYGQYLLDAIKTTITISNFESLVKSVPNYLKGDDISKPYTIESINYSVPANYFAIYGELYVEKLSEYMVLQGNEMVKKSLTSSSKTIYKKIEFNEAISTEGILSGNILILPS